MRNIDDELPGSAAGFSFTETASGRVRIQHLGKTVVTLAGPEAARFLRRVSSADAGTAQLLMAKATGQFKRGNERLSRLKGKR